LEQVAAVCYRVRGASVEFLLVRTRNGRWTFPKGGAESGLTHSQAAALEAFEEAGVHGRMEEAAFTQYRRGKRINMQEFGAGIVHAYLCEVLRLGTPQEANRNRTWFSAEKAKWQLRENRTAENGAEMARVIDCAVARIQGRG
jgi:8-oxo-dGTP pyrophosphatase MutT (NUDIX family)